MRLGGSDHTSASNFGTLTRACHGPMFHVLVAPTAMGNASSFPTSNARARARHGVIHGCLGYLEAPSIIDTRRVVAAGGDAMGNYRLIEAATQYGGKSDCVRRRAR